MRITSTRLSAATNALMALLSEYRNDLVEGRLPASDPYYPENITPDIVECCLKGIEDYIWSDIHKAGGSHATWQHARVPGAPKLTKDDLRPPRFLEMPYDSQLAVVQGMHRVLNPFRATDEEIAEEEKIAEMQRQREEAYAAERAANLARDPNFYDSEALGYC